MNVTGRLVIWAVALCFIYSLPVSNEANVSNVEDYRRSCTSGPFLTSLDLEGRKAFVSEWSSDQPANQSEAVLPSLHSGTHAFPSSTSSLLKHISLSTLQIGSFFHLKFICISTWGWQRCCPWTVPHDSPTITRTFSRICTANDDISGNQWIQLILIALEFYCVLWFRTPTGYGIDVLICCFLWHLPSCNTWD